MKAFDVAISNQLMHLCCPFGNVGPSIKERKRKGENSSIGVSG